MTAVYKFFAMLGPAEEHPVGSLPWAERIAHRLQITLENVARNEQREIKYLPPILEAILDAKPRPWMIWPPDNPCRTPEAWFEIVTGKPITSVRKLVEAYEPNSPLIRKLLAVEAEDNPLRAPRGGRPPGSKNNPATGGVSPGDLSTNSTRHILARLARDHPDILAAYKRGEFKSAKAAGIAAGFIKPPTALDTLRKTWRKATEEERQTFLGEVCGKDP